MLPSFTVILSPLLLRPSAPVEAVWTSALPKVPVGVPPPKTTIAQLAGMIVLAGKVCRMV